MNKTYAEVAADIAAGKAHRCRGCRKVCYEGIEGIRANRRIGGGPLEEEIFCSTSCANAAGFGHRGVEAMQTKGDEPGDLIKED